MRKIFFGTFLLLLAGCGGGGSGSGGSSANSPHLTVFWTTRSKSVTAPDSALSCQFSIQQGTGKSYTITGNRSSSITAYNATYYGNGVAPAGQYQLTGSFYAQPGQNAPLVGTVSAPVSVASDGTIENPDGSVLSLSFTGIIKSVSVNPNQSVAVGKTVQLYATAYDGSGNPVIVTPGSFQFGVVGLQNDLTVTQAGIATGVAAGSGSVEATVDSVESNAELVIVGPVSATYDAFALTTSDIAYDSIRNVIYAACTPSSPTYAGQVSTIDLVGNGFGLTYPVTNNPAHLAVSTDGIYLYVAGNNGTIQQVNLNTGKIEQTIALPKGTIPNQISAIPGLPESFAVSLANSTDTITDEGTVLIDGTKLRPTIAKIGLSFDFNSAGTRIYGVQLYKTSGTLYSSADVTASGIANVKSESTVVQGYANRIHWTGGKIVSDSGAVLNPDTGATIGQFPLPAASTLAVPVAGSDVVYFLSSNPYLVGRYSLSSLSKNFSVQVDGPTGVPNRAISLGANRIGFHSVGGSPSAVYSISGLP